MDDRQLAERIAARLRPMILQEIRRETKQCRRRKPGAGRVTAVHGNQCDIDYGNGEVLHGVPIETGTPIQIGDAVQVDYYESLSFAFAARKL